MNYGSDLQHQGLRLTHNFNTVDFFAELTGCALLGEKALENSVHVAIGQCALKLRAHGRKRRRFGATQSSGSLIEQLAPGRVCQRFVRMLPMGELGVLPAKSLHRHIDQPCSIGQTKLDAFVQRRFECFFGLRTAPGHDHSFKIGLLGRLLEQSLVKTPPHQGLRLAVVFQQLVIDRQT